VKEDALLIHPGDCIPGTTPNRKCAVLGEGSACVGSPKTSAYAGLAPLNWLSARQFHFEVVKWHLSSRSSYSRNKNQVEV
jgi:hypothetical protein